MQAELAHTGKIVIMQPELAHTGKQYHASRNGPHQKNYNAS